MNPSEKLPGKGMSRLLTVFLVVLIDLMGFGIILPLMPFYASEFGATPVMIGILYSIYSVAQLVFSPIWGSWSDRIGRRPIMLLSTFGAAGAYVLFGLAESFTVLFVSRLLAGVMGGNIATAQAYIADVTSVKDRARGMGLIGAAFGLGFVMGPVLATALIQPAIPAFLADAGFTAASGWVEAHRYGLPAFFAALMSLISFLMVWFRLEETVKRGAKKGSAEVVDSSLIGEIPDTGAGKSTGSLEKTDNPGETDFMNPGENDSAGRSDARVAAIVPGVAAAGRGVSASDRKVGVFTPTYWKTLFDMARTSPSGFVLVLLMGSFFVLSFGQSSLYSAFPLFCEKILGMDAAQVGLQFFWLGLVTAFVQGLMIRPLTKVFSEEQLFLAGNVLMAAGMFLLGTASTTGQLTSYLVLLAVGHSLNLPTLTSLISQTSDPERMGATIGVSQGLSGLGRAIGPTWGGLLFTVHAAVPFWVTSAIILLTVWAGVLILKKRRESV